MASFFLKQPTGKLAYFSNVVDDFTYYDLTEEEALELAREEGGAQHAREKVDRALGDEFPFEDGDEGTDGLRRWRHALATIEVLRGKTLRRRRERQLGSTNINHLPMDEICGNCGRKREEHYPRADWQCPSVGFYFNQPSPIVRRIAEAAGYDGLSDRQWMSDIDGLVEHVRELRVRARS